MVRVVPIHIIGAASGFGARDPGCAEGPDTLRDSGVVSKLQAQGINLSWRTILYPGNAKPILRIIQEFNEQLALEVASVAASRILPLVIGGDHSCAIGTWSGTFLAIRQHGPLGLIWIDAHMDSHTPRTSPSGAIHGMPLAVLLGQGLPELVNIATPKAKLLPRHLCLIGIRSYEEGEAELLRSLGVRVFFMEEVKRRGIYSVMSEALEIVCHGTAGFGISIDLDAFKPKQSPGVGSPEKGGLHFLKLIQVIRGIASHPRLLALELAEYNPRHDCQRRTLRLIGDLMAALGQPVEYPQGGGIQVEPVMRYGY